ncbi:hypothetical protein ACFE04_030093 [Oxalis oulophora]
MSSLSDVAWKKIMEFGKNEAIFTTKEFCALSMTCKQLHRLADEDSFWMELMYLSFPDFPKDKEDKLYAEAFEEDWFKEKEQKKQGVLAAERSVASGGLVVQNAWKFVC